MEANEKAIVYTQIDKIRMLVKHIGYSIDDLNNYERKKQNQDRYYPSTIAIGYYECYKQTVQLLKEIGVEIAKLKAIKTSNGRINNYLAEDVENIQTIVYSVVSGCSTLEEKCDTYENLEKTNYKELIDRISSEDLVGRCQRILSYSQGITTNLINYAENGSIKIEKDFEKYGQVYNAELIDSINNKIRNRVKPAEVKIASNGLKIPQVTIDELIDFNFRAHVMKDGKAWSKNGKEKFSQDEYAYQKFLCEIQIELERESTKIQIELIPLTPKEKIIYLNNKINEIVKNKTEKLIAPGKTIVECIGGSNIDSAVGVGSAQYILGVNGFNINFENGDISDYEFGRMRNTRISGIVEREEPIQEATFVDEFRKNYKVSSLGDFERRFGLALSEMPIKRREAQEAFKHGRECTALIPLLQEYIKETDYEKRYKILSKISSCNRYIDSTKYNAISPEARALHTSSHETKYAYMQVCKKFNELENIIYEKESDSMSEEDKVFQNKVVGAMLECCQETQEAIKKLLTKYSQGKIDFEQFNSSYLFTKFEDLSTFESKLRVDVAKMINTSPQMSSDVKEYILSGGNRYTKIAQNRNDTLTGLEEERKLEEERRVQAEQERKQRELEEKLAREIEEKEKLAREIAEQRAKEEERLAKEKLEQAKAEEEKKQRRAKTQARKRAEFKERKLAEVQKRQEEETKKAGGKRKYGYNSQNNSENIVPEVAKITKEDLRNAGLIKPEEEGKIVGMLEKGNMEFDKDKKHQFKSVNQGIKYVLDSYYKDYKMEEGKEKEYKEDMADVLKWSIESTELKDMPEMKNFKEVDLNKIVEVYLKHKQEEEQEEKE